MAFRTESVPSAATAISNAPDAMSFNGSSAWTGPQHRQVIRVDVNRVPADVIRGTSNRVGRDDEVAVARVDDRGIFANLRTEEQARIMSWKLPEQ